MTLTMPTIIRGMPDEQYHQHPAFGSTDVKTARRSLAHYLARKRGADKDTPAKLAGRILHCCVLQPHLFDATYAVLPPNAPADQRRHRDAKKPSEDTLRSIAWWDSWESNNPGKTIIANALYDECRRIAEAVREHPELRGYFVAPEGEAELSVFALDPETGLACKARLDYRVRLAGLLTKIELKFCEDVRPGKFKVTSEQYGYFMQNVYYEDVCEWAGEPIDLSLTVAIEKEDATAFNPGCYPIRIYEPGPASRERGREQYREGLALLAHAAKTGEYPAYDTAIEVLEPPSWAA
jgi:hypothetical protein